MGNFLLTFVCVYQNNMVQGMEHRVLDVFCKCPTTDPHPQIFFFKGFVLQATFELMTFLSARISKC